MVNQAKTKRIIRQLSPKVTPIGKIGSEPLILPNHSGYHGSQALAKTPTKDFQLANKKYVDDKDFLKLDTSNDPLTGNLNINADIIYGRGAARRILIEAQQGTNDGSDLTIEGGAASSPLFGPNKDGGNVLIDGGIKAESGTTGDVKISTVRGVATLGDGAKLVTSAAPGADAEIANKKYVDDEDAAADTHITSDGSSHSLSHAESHSVASHSDTTGTGAELDELTDGSETTLHSHAASPHTPEGTAVLSTGEGGGTKFLREDGDGTCSWQATAGGGGTPGGSDTEVQFNDGGSFGGDSALVWNKTDNRLGINQATPLAPLHIKTDSSGLAIRIEENSGTEFYSIRTAANGDLEFVQDGGTVVMALQDSGTDILAKSGVERIGDSNTALQFAGTDNLILKAGGNGLRILNGEVIINHSGLADDFRVESNNEDKLFLINGGLDLIRMGDGDTNYMQVSSGGDVTFVGGAGLAYANMYAQDNAVATTITTAGIANKVQLTIFGVDGPSNNATPDHTNDHITITKAGHYLATVDITASGVGGDQDTFVFSLWKNNGNAEFANVHGHETMAGGVGDINDISLTGIIDLAVNDTIEVWCWNEDDNDNVLIDDISLTLVQVGGT